MTSYRYVPDGKGGVQAVAMPGPAVGEQWQDDPGPLPSPERLLQMQAVRDQLAAHAAPRTPQADADLVLSGKQAEGKLDKGTVKPGPPPASPAERDARVIAARQLAARLGYDLRTVPKLSGERVFDALTGKPAGYAGEILTLVDALGNCFPVGPLEAIESELVIRARQLAARERADAEADARNAEYARVQAEALASSPAARLARIEAERDEMKAQLAQLLAEREKV